MAPAKTHATTPEELKGYFVTPHEARCHADGNSREPCPDCGGKIYVSFRVLERFKALRTRCGKPLTVTSAYRCNAKERRIWAQELARYGGNARKAARVKAPPTGNGPHEKGEALDVARPSGFTQLEWGQYIVESCQGDVRVGCRSYGGFAHMDTLHKVRKGLRTGIRW